MTANIVESNAAKFEIAARISLAIVHFLVRSLNNEDAHTPRSITLYCKTREAAKLCGWTRKSGQRSNLQSRARTVHVFVGPLICGLRGNSLT